MAKKYALDTNVFFKDYKCIEKLLDKDENEVYVCSTVLEELDKHKSDVGVGGYNVRKSIRWMDENSDRFNFVISDHYEGINDDKIIKSAKDSFCILISNDLNVRLKCKALGMESEEYKAVESIELGELRKGKHIIKDNQLLADIYEGKNRNKLDFMYENDFVLFYDNEELRDVMQIKEGKFKNVKLYDKTFSGASPKHLEQKLALTHLFNTDLELITFSGTFGSSKTFMMLGSALELVNQGRYDKIYIAKAPISLDKNLETGFKPSGHLEKMELPLGSVTSNLKNLRGNDKFSRMYTGMRILEEYINQGTMEVLSLEDILGMSLSPRSILLIEEAQVLNDKVCRALLSRINENSIIFMNGDLAQSSGNNLIAEDTGFFKIINMFAGYEKSAHLTLETVMRSKFVAELDRRWNKSE